MKPDWVANVIESSFGVLFLFSGIWLISVVNSNGLWNMIFIESCLGLLTFISVFYAFVLKREFTDKRENLLTNMWKENFPIVDKLIRQIKNEIGKEEKNFRQLSNDSEKLYNTIESVSSFEEETHIERALFRSTVLYILSILLFIIDTVTGYKVLFNDVNYTFRFIGFISFWFANYYSVKIIVKWFQIISKR